MKATVQTPATIGNFGPGFDVFALALAGEGDRVELKRAPQDTIEVDGPGSDQIPTQWDRNVAGATVDALRARTGLNHRFHVRLHKRRLGGSGLGSSASSSGGVALAFNALEGTRLAPADLIRAGGEGEAVASGRHYDDVAAVVLGGLAVVRTNGESLDVSRVPPPKSLHLAVVAPRLALLTRDMRRVLPDAIPRADAVFNLGNAVRLLDAFHRGDVAAIGSCLEDRIATPARRRFVPFYEHVRLAAVKKGAAGAALSGSGPAMFAVCDSRPTAEAVAREMRRVVESYQLPAEAFAARPESEVMYRAVSVR